MEILGYEFKVKKPKQNIADMQTFDISSVADRDDINIISNSESSEFNAFSYSLAQLPQDDVNIINTYRNIAIAPEVDQYLNEIFNEAFIFDIDNKRSFGIGFYDEDSDEDCKVPKNVRKKIADEVENLYEIMDFSVNGREWFSNFYIDGRIKAQIIVDSKKPRNGIQKVLKIDPLKLRKVRIIPEPDKHTGTYDMSKVKQFYIYNQQFDQKYNSVSQYYELQNNTQQNIMGNKISEHAILDVTSGLRDRNSDKTIGWLHKAIVPFNNLKMMEQSMIIFRVVRSPMRRAFYVDVNDMQPSKVENYLKNMKAKFSTKPIYNATSGTFNDNNSILSMMEDYYLPRKDGRTTEIVNLEGQSSQEILEEVTYFRDKLQRSMNVPTSRFDDQPSSFFYGDNQEILRDEYRFKKFINYCRMRFMMLFDEMLKRQLMLKDVIRTDAEWNDIKSEYFWTFAEDNAFVQYKEVQILNSKLEQLDRITPHLGKFYSKEYVAINILNMSEDDWDKMKEQMKKEREEEPQDDEM